MHIIDINCDLGEGKNTDDCVRDARIMRYISRCNIACGGHAGNATTMAISLENARRHALVIGAHPGYPDRDNFGRIALAMEREDLLASVGEQVRALAALAAEQQIVLSHIKLHGALYNDAEANDSLAADLVAFINREFPGLNILGLANAAMERAAKKFQHPFLREGFMDRRYLNEQQLSPRSMPGAVIAEHDRCLDQLIALAKGQPFLSIGGETLQFAVDSICLHGDTPDAEAIARALYRQLQQAGLLPRR